MRYLNISKNNLGIASTLLVVVSFAVIITLMSSLHNVAQAAYGKVPNSRVDPAILRVDEKEHLGVLIDNKYVFVDAAGREFTMEDLRGKPTIVVFSYYRCDGSCTAINKTLRATLRKVKEWEMGEDYNVLTLSFDPNDTTDSLNTFLEYSGFDKGLPHGWRMATFKNPAEIEELTASVGFKYFWEPRDQVFLHPSVYVVASPEGRVTRYLYVASIKSEDIAVSITKAYGGELLETKVIDFLIGACYSYNYKEGKYSLNYPIFIAVGALGIAISSLLGGSIFMKRRVQP